MPRHAFASALVLLTLLAPVRAQLPVPAPKEPPEPLKEALVIVGGGPIPDAAITTFAQLAGGPKGRLVVFPTAGAAADKGDPEARKL
jgi:hypothetical protein